LNTRPWVWFSIAAAGLIPFIGPRLWKKALGAGILIAIILLTFQRDTETSRTFWSPYQKLQYHLDYISTDDGSNEPLPYAYLNINSVYYMAILDLSDAAQKKHPGIFRKDAIIKAAAPITGGMIGPPVEAQAQSLQHSAEESLCPSLQV
jgi:hypothetical protein